MATDTYAQKKQRLIEQVQANNGQPLGLSKDTSNLFRDREEMPKRKLDVRAFNQVLAVNAEEGWIEVEGMTPFSALVDAALPHGVMPPVVPQLRSITIGGAVSGVGIEAASFKYGLVHETVLEMEVLLGDGQVVTCTPDNEHKDLFYGLPNSYGTLGYVLKLKIKAIPVKPYVHFKHIQHSDPVAYFKEVDYWCKQADVDFVDGVVFGRDEMYITVGRFADDAPFVSDYTYKHIFYKSIREKPEDYLTVHDFIWRWDTDWFWCSKNLLAQNPVVRRLLGPSRLNSVFYTKVMRWNSRWGLSKHINKLLGIHSESVIQDVDIPIQNAPAFLEFFHREIGILPVWICPIRAYRKDVRFDLYPVDPNKLYVNFGFWDAVQGRTPMPPGHYNRLVEAKVAELGGIKSLYSDSYFTLDEFWQRYDKDAYTRLKSRYDPRRMMKDLYEKCVLRK